MPEAIEKFYNIPKGRLINYTDDYANITETVAFATGREESNLCFNLFDSGEGQLPDFMPYSFLSLPFGKANPYKQNIPFVQGRYNQGGNGSIRFAEYTLIVTKRAPTLLTPNARKITDPSIESEMKNAEKTLEDAYQRQNEWGWTIIRKFTRKSDSERTWYGYYAPDGIIPSCSDSELKLHPPIKLDTISRKLTGKKKQDALLKLRQNATSTAYSVPVSSGTLIKLFDYPFKKALRNPFWADVNRELRSKSFYNIGLPVRLLELREFGTLVGGSGEGAYLSGWESSVITKEQNSKKKNTLVRKGWPKGPDIIEIPFNEIKTIYPSSKITIIAYIIEPQTETDQSSKWIDDTSVIYHLNGQIHWHEKAQYLSRFKYYSLKNSLLVSIDISQIREDIRDEIFRVDRASKEDNTPEWELLREYVEEWISENKAIQEVNQEKFYESGKDVELDQKKKERIISNLVQKYPDMLDMLQGKEIPVATGGVKLVKSRKKKDLKKTYGKKSPTFFNFLGNKK